MNAMADLNINGYAMTTFTSHSVISGACNAPQLTLYVPAGYLGIWIGIIGMCFLPRMLSGQSTGLEVTGNAGTIQNDRASVSWAIGAISPGTHAKADQQLRVGHIYPSIRFSGDTPPTRSTPLVRAFPNPFTERIDLLPITDQTNRLTIQVQDALGRQVHSQVWPDPTIRCTLELDHLPAGAYSVTLRLPDGSTKQETLKILKKEL